MLVPPSPPVAPRGAASSEGFSRGAVVWSIFLSLAIIAIIGFVTEFELAVFAELARNLNPWIMGGALLMLALRVLFGAWRLQYVSHGRLGFMPSLRGQLAWDFFSNVTPSAIGGGPFAAVYVAKDRGIPVGESTALLLFSMLLDQFWTATTVFIILAAMLFMPVFPASLGTWAVVLLVGYFVCMLAWTVVFAWALLRRPDWLETMITRLFRFRWLRRFEERATREVHQLRHRATILRTQSLGFYLNGFLLTTASWLARYAMLVFIVWGVYDALDKDLFLVRSMAMTMGSLIMPTPGGAGGVEGFYALFLGPLMPERFLAPTLLAWRVLGYYLFIALGAYLSMHSVRSTRRRGHAHRPSEPQREMPRPVAQPLVERE